MAVRRKRFGARFWLLLFLGILLGFPLGALDVSLGGNLVRGRMVEQDVLSRNSAEQRERVFFSYWGADGFWDFTYGVMGIGFCRNMWAATKEQRDLTGSVSVQDYDWDLGYLRLTLHGKYPLEVLPSLTVAPAVGFSGWLNFAARDETGQSLSAEEEEYDDFHKFTVEVGIYGDKKINDNMYQRIRLLGGYNLAAKEADKETAAQDYNMEYSASDWFISGSAGFGFQL